MQEFNKPINEEIALSICNYNLDRNLQAIHVDGGYIRLRNKLWSVLVFLVENKNILISRNELINNIWEGNRLTGEQGTTHAICHLRKTFKQFNIDATITTIPKSGYVLQEFKVKKNPQNEKHNEG